MARPPGPGRNETEPCSFAGTWRVAKVLTFVGVTTPCPLDEKLLPGDVPALGDAACENRAELIDGVAMATAIRIHVASIRPNFDLIKRFIRVSPN